MILSEIFSRVLHMSITASVVIAIVCVVRLFLKSVPKIYSYLLWALVLIRLLCPVSFVASYSMIPDTVSSGTILSEWEDDYIGQTNTIYDNHSEYDAAVDAGRETFSAEEGHYYVVTGSDGISEPNTVGNTIIPVLSKIWIIGILALILHSVLSIVRIRKQTRISVPLRKGVYLADDVASPFVMGLLRPTIYLPGSLDSSERKYIIAHERHHIRRGDHILKALGFLALMIHWFNPLVWLAFVLASRDMEMSCDEAVIRKFGEDVRADYSASLLNLATGHRLFAGTPLAFGEGDPTGRVRNLAKWKKPKRWIILVCVILCVVLAVCLLTDPETIKPMELSQQTLKTLRIVMHNDPLPDGFYESRDDKGNLIITDGINTVGGVVCYSIPEGIYNPDDHIEVLLYKMGIPDYVDTGLYFRGGMTHGDNGWLAEFVNEMPEGEDPTIYRRHHFSIVEDMVYDIWFDMTKVEYEKTEEIRVCINLPEGKPQELKEWGVSINPDRVSRTGATALFVYSGSIPGEEGAELTYGDFMSLDRLVDGTWVPCDERAGYDYYVGDSSYPVVDGYGMVHEWPDRFGELADGYYRLGKEVTLIRTDGSRESRMVYGEFALPESVRTGLSPLNQLPEKYSAEQAMIDGCFVTEDGFARENKELFQDFAVCSLNGMPGVIRIVNWHYGEDSQWNAIDLSYDGNVYTISTMSDSQTTRYLFRYLKHYTGEKAWEGADHDAFDYYVLVNDDNVTFEDIMTGKLDMSDSKNPAHWTVYADLIYLPEQPQLPQNPAKAVLEFEGKELVTTTDFDRLEKIWILFSKAEFLGYEPKTHSVGVGLNLILTSKDGETMTIELDPDSDICRINGEYVFYGAYDEPDYIEKLWYYLGIEAWPEEVYDKCANAYRPYSVG